MSSALFGLARQACQAVGKRCMATNSEEGFKVAVLGAAGGIGQPLSLLMKARSRLNLLEPSACLTPVVYVGRHRR